MKVHIAAEATHDEASAIAAAVAEHTGRTVEVFVGEEETPTLVRRQSLTSLTETGTRFPIAVYHLLGGD